MAKRTTVFMSLITTALLSIAMPLQAELPAKEQVCRTCHGEGGAKTLIPTYPKLNGQNKAYLVQVLKAYKAGERKGGMSQLMVAQAQALSDADIEALAEYYSSQK